MSRKENTAESTGSGAEQASTNGHVDPADLPANIDKRAKVNGDNDDGGVDVNGLRPGEEGYQPFNRPSVNAKHAEEAQYGSPTEAGTVGGLYAAEHGVERGILKRDSDAYERIAGLESVALTDARAVGLDIPGG